MNLFNVFRRRAFIFFFFLLSFINSRTAESLDENLIPPKETIVITDSLIQQSLVYLPIQKGFEVTGGIIIGGAVGNRIGYYLLPHHDPFNVGIYMGMWSVPTLIYGLHLRYEIKRVKKELFEKYADYTIIDRSSKYLNFWRGFSFRVGTNVLLFQGKQLPSEKNGLTLINSHEWPVFKGFHYGYEFSQYISKARMLNKKILSSEGNFISNSNLDIQLNNFNVALLCKYKQQISSKLSTHISMAPAIQYVDVEKSNVENLDYVKFVKDDLTAPLNIGYDYQEIYERDFFDLLGNWGLAIDYGLGIQYDDYFLEIRYTKSYNDIYCLDNLYFKEKLNTLHLSFGLLLN
ncbi:MAG TPA: hypothetical protein PLP19_17450 [bacterium]|nr:hypothetical protein [bacterium]HPN45281.1 hypothetical protein [bacterium]